MFCLKSNKAQSTAEYAITLGLVIAVGAGVMSTALKNGMRQKNDQAVNYLLSAGNDQDAFKDASGQTVSLYSQERRDTTIYSGDDFVDTTVMNKGGSEKRRQKQRTSTTAVAIETINAGTSGS